MSEQRHRWTEAEDNVLRKFYRAEGGPFCAERVGGVDARQVNLRAHRLGLAKKRDSVTHARRKPAASVAPAYDFGALTAAWPRPAP